MNFVFKHMCVYKDMARVVAMIWNLKKSINYAKMLCLFYTYNTQNAYHFFSEGNIMQGYLRLSRIFSTMILHSALTFLCILLEIRR